MQGIRKPISELPNVLINKDNNCDVCEEDIFFDQNDSQWRMRIENSNYWDTYNDEFSYQYIEINFCYSCGKNYNKEANK